MEPQLRKSIIRKTRQSERLQQSKKECPVCLETLSKLTKKNNVFAFPCGHVVCDACNTKLLERSMHKCPTCRTIRAGFSEYDVDNNNTNDGTQNTNSQQNPRGNVVIVFQGRADSGSPLDVLDSLLRRTQVINDNESFDIFFSQERQQQS